MARKKKNDATSHFSKTALNILALTGASDLGMVSEEIDHVNSRMRLTFGESSKYLYQTGVISSESEENLRLQIGYNVELLASSQKLGVAPPARFNQEENAEGSVCVHTIHTLSLSVFDSNGELLVPAMPFMKMVSNIEDSVFNKSSEHAELFGGISKSFRLTRKRLFEMSQLEEMHRSIHSAQTVPHVSEVTSMNLAKELSDVRETHDEANVKATTFFSQLQKQLEEFNAERLNEAVFSDFKVIFEMFPDPTVQMIIKHQFLTAYRIALAEDVYSKDTVDLRENASSGWEALQTNYPDDDSWDANTDESPSLSEDDEPSTDTQFSSSSEDAISRAEAALEKIA